MIKLGGLINLPGVGKFEQGQVVSNPYARAFTPIKEEETIEEQDHEVSMAQNSLDSIIKNASELKQKVGEMEKNIPGWIQDHITNSENYIEQANSGYHELAEAKLNEASLVSFNELDPKIQSKIKFLEKLIGGKHIAIFDGIHGMIVDIKKSSMGGPYRFDASQLNQLLKANIRWVEGDKDGVSIGF
jgi:hypothetical protein